LYVFSDNLTTHKQGIKFTQAQAFGRFSGCFIHGLNFSRLKPKKLWWVY